MSSYYASYESLIPTSHEKSTGLVLRHFHHPLGHITPTINAHLATSPLPPAAASRNTHQILAAETTSPDFDFDKQRFKMRHVVRSRSESDACPTRGMRDDDLPPAHPRVGQPCQLASSCNLFSHIARCKDIKFCACVGVVGGIEFPGASLTAKQSQVEISGVFHRVASQHTRYWQPWLLHSGQDIRRWLGAFGSERFLIWWMVSRK